MFCMCYKRPLENQLTAEGLPFLNNNKKRHNKIIHQGDQAINVSFDHVH